MTTCEIQSREAARQALQERLDAQRTASERNQLGQFATPNALAIEMAKCVRSLWDRQAGPIRFADPAVGTGSFFSAALAIFSKDQLESAVGIELDAAFCDAAREIWSEAGLEVVSGDFTRNVAN